MEREALGAERLIKIADEIYGKYLDEVEKNGGREGSTLAFYNLSQLNLMKELLAEVGVVYEFVRRIL